MNWVVCFTIFTFGSCLLAGSAIGQSSLTDDDDVGWYAPSRKSPIYAHKYNKLIKQEFDRQGEEMRLPGNILPVWYRIQLLPFIEEGKFYTDGSVEIFLQCVQSTNEILFNSADIDIDLASVTVVTSDTNLPLNMVDIVQEADREIVTVRMERQLAAGLKYKLSMKFRSYLNDELRGFYRSSYVENGATKWLAVSQMEAPDARRAFPCFDEPKMKARFTVILGRKLTMTSVSNMPLKESVPIDGMLGYVWDSYESSLPMSTYLVAFLVSEFISVESDPSLSRVQFRIWARPSFRNQTEYARDIGPRILHFYETFFNIEFPLPKQDMAAIPDFAAGAMENWGLITYREADLLIDSKKSSASAHQRVAVVVAHELAHQWFGDLVTMDWWNVIWLNEGFATYMEYIGTNSVEPAFEMQKQIIYEDLHYVFGIDALESSRPMNIQVNTPDQINQMFDAISYEKGGCVIRMLDNFLGTETFKKGLTLYLQRKAYDTATQDDLWAALNQAAENDGLNLPVPVKTIMDTWTLQMGFPVINITRNYADNSARLTQQRFLLIRNAASTDSSRWWVPLTFSSDFSRPHASDWMPNNQSDMQINNVADPGQWVIFNVDQVGYYRVVYDDVNLGLIADQLKSDHVKINSNNRAQLLDDYLNMARADLVPYAKALDLTLYLSDERDYVWKAAFTALDFIDSMLYNSAGYALWRPYINNLIIPLYNDIGFEERPDDKHLQLYTRNNALDWVCRFGNADCLSKTRAAYAAWMKDPDNDELISPNQKRLIACYAIKHGADAEWEFAYQKYLQSDVANEKRELLSAMSCSREQWLLTRMLEMMIDPKSGIRLQDANNLFSYVANNPFGNFIAFNFLRNRWNDIDRYFSGYVGFGGGSLPRLFQSVASKINTRVRVDQLRQLRDDHLNQLGSSARVQQAIELAESNVKWMNLHYQEIVNWLQP